MTTARSRRPASDLVARAAMITRLSCAILVAAIWPVASCAAAAGGECPIHVVALSRDGGWIGHTRIVLSDGTAPPGGAMAWDQPLRLRHADGSTCTVDDAVSIITAPIYAAGDRILYVTTYSGSQSAVFAVAARNCAIRWQSPVFTQGPTLTGQTLTFGDAPPVRIGSDCLPTKR